MSSLMATRRSPFRAFAGRFVVAFVVATVAMGGAVFAVNYVFDEQFDKAERIEVETAAAPPEGANFLVIGSDTRAFVDNAAEEESFGSESETGGSRSDTMMVVHVEPDAQRTLVVSFPRDLWVDIPGMGNSKINAAFNEGPDKVIETLRANFGIEINHYIEVNFKSFQGIVKAIGNVPVYFPYPSRDEKTGLFIYEPGCVRLDGLGSLAYVRARSLEYFDRDDDKWISADAVPDINRIQRQQDFIRRLAGLAVAKSLNNPFTAYEISNRVFENLTVDDSLTKDDVKSLVKAFRTINPNDTSALDFQTLAWENGPRQGELIVLYPREEANDVGPGWREQIAQLQEFGGAGGAVTEPSQVSVKVLNASGQSGAAAGVLAEFERLGFRDKGTGNDDRGTITQTEVRYKPGAVAEGRLVLQYIDPDARLVEDPQLKGADVAVVLGADFRAVVVPTTATTAPAAGAPATTADTTPATTPTTSSRTTPTTIANAGELGTAAPRDPPC